jgi:hypothetical protein
VFAETGAVTLNVAVFVPAPTSGVFAQFASDPEAGAVAEVENVHPVDCHSELFAFPSPVTVMLAETVAPDATTSGLAIVQDPVGQETVAAL